MKQGDHGPVSAVDAIVVGAGIAGLAAAHRLQQAGQRVAVLEAAARVGGRMSSEILNGHVVDRGAQYLSTGYAILARLISEMGLDASIRATSRLCAIVREGRPRVICIDRPLDAWSSGLLSLASILKLGWHTAGAARSRSLSRYDEWAELDDETSQAWAERQIGKEVCDYLFDPMLQGFYFQDPAETSRALAMVVAGFGSRREATVTLEGGLGELPDALARRLDVRLDSPVSWIRPSEAGVSVTLPSGEMQARRAILALPAPAASQIADVASLDTAARALLATPYSTSINVSICTDAAFALPPELAGVYGLLIPKRERSSVAAVGIENEKRRHNGGAGRLLNLMLCNESARQLMHAPDDIIIDAALRSIEPLFPSLSRSVAGSQVIRWPCAEPMSPVGRATAIRRYRDRQSTHPSDILLAGDYMGMPFTEGAAESGEWAAQTILDTLTCKPAARHPHGVHPTPQTAPSLLNADSVRP